MNHLPYAGFLVCPRCIGRAVNLTFIPPREEHVLWSRRMFRFDDGRPSASKRLISCQKCGHGFTIEEARLITLPT